MFFRRPSGSSNRPAHVSRKHRGLPTQRRAERYSVESLESRVLLTTLTSTAGGNTVFEYMDGHNDVMRIVLHGNITAEFIGVAMPYIPTGTEPPSPVEPTAANLRPPILSPTTNYGIDLFEIYVTRADLDSSIAIAAVPSITSTPRPMQPFNGTAGDFRITSTSGQQLVISPESSTGGAILGTRSRNTAAGTTVEEEIPQDTIFLKQDFGVRPRSLKGRLDPGLVVANGQDLGQFLFGGTVMGTVSLSGSMDLFYAGQLWTGDPGGIGTTVAPTHKRNFNVAGDLRSLMTLGSIGTDGAASTGNTGGDFKSGVDIQVAGRLGQVYSKSNLDAAVQVMHDANIRGTGRTQYEVEVRGANPTGSNTFFQGLDVLTQDPRLAAPSLGDNALFNNDSPESAQHLGTAFSNAVGKGTDFVIHLEGNLIDTNAVGDRIDYYAVSLVAGQTAEVKTTSIDPTTQGLIATGIIDPEGRVVASDLSNKDALETMERKFRFTAKEPGIYKIAISRWQDANFNAVTDGEELGGSAGPVAYSLDVSRVGDIALGGVVSGRNMAFTDVQDPLGLVFTPFNSINVANGDLGAVLATGERGSNSIIASVALPITVRRGNLRAMEADSIGVIVNGGVALGPDLLVPRGIVGLLRGRGSDTATQVVSVNPNYIDLVGDDVDPTTSIGFDYQLVDANAVFAGNLIADRGIGVIRADVFLNPRLAVNADGLGNDGFIDLLDARTQFGTLNGGGPQITTGPGGNVRYIHVDNPTAVFRDSYFGGGGNTQISLSAGKAFTYSDDSGTPVKISTLPGTRDTTGAIVNPVTMVLETYGIRDKGGSVLIDVATNSVITTDGVQQASGLLVDTGTNGGAGGAEIGSMRLIGTGSPVTFAAATRAFTTTSTTTQTQTVTLKGRRTIDVFDISGTHINTIDNRTDGELINIEAESIGTISATSLGIGRTKTLTEIQSVDVRRDVFPFNGQRALVNVSSTVANLGNIESLQIRKQMGNIFASGTIGTVRANSDNANDKKVFEGIVGPIVVDDNIIDVNIGEGLATSGSGEFALGGLFADGVIANVTNQGAGSDIRGDIVSTGSTTLPEVIRTDPTTGVTLRPLPAINGIGTITLNNGSIIDADIYITRFVDSLETHFNTILITQPIGDIDAPVNSINSIVLQGNGGIIGAGFAGGNVGKISVKGGFGVIDSLFLLTATTVFDGLDTDGYGIRKSSFDGGEMINYIVARGTGKVLDTRSYSASVRQSENSEFDSFTGRQVAPYNDLHTFLGTTAAKPKNSFTSISGSIDDSLFTGAQNLGVMDAYNIRGSFDPLTGDTMRISFSQNVTKMTVRNIIDGLRFTSGDIKSFSVGKDMANARVDISGLLQSMAIGGNLKASSRVSALGPEGRIKSISTKRALFGRITATTKIDTISVGTDFGSPGVSSSNDIGTVIINGSMLDGSFLRAADQIVSLNIGHNIDAGAIVRAKRITNTSIKGAVNGQILTG